MKLKLSDLIAGGSQPPATANTTELRAPQRIDEINPTGLLDYQVPSVFTLSRAIARFRAAADTSDTGTGKTYTSLAVARQLGLRSLIVCPKSVITAWRRVAKFLNVEVHDIINYERLKGGKYGHVKWVSKTTMAADGDFEWKVPGDVLLIFDEAHRCKAQFSQNAKLLISARRQGIPLLMASATLATNPLEMRGVGYALGLHFLTNFFQWCRRHGCETHDFGGLGFDKKDEKNKKILLGIHNQIFPERGVRISISELGDAFPESQLSAEAYDMNGNTAKINKVYEHMQDELAALAKRTENYSAQIFAVMMRARMQAELLKVPALIEQATDAIDEGMSVCIFVNFQATIDALRARLKDSAVVQGGQSQEDRDANIDAFQADEKHIIICNIAAGGVGISLHDVRGERPRLSLISPNYSAIQLVQAIGRAWRQGGKSATIQRVVFAAGTIEETACDAVRTKLENLALLNDGDLTAGIQF